MWRTKELGIFLFHNWFYFWCFDFADDDSGIGFPFWVFSMTPAPPHKEPEYIVTEKRIKDFENNLPEYMWIGGCRCKTSIVIAEIRYCKYIITLSEREKVLQELFIWIDSEQTITITTDKIIKKILSLRTTTTPPDTSVLSDRNWT